jgi:hypothetical protein
MALVIRRHEAAPACIRRLIDGELAAAITALAPGAPRPADAVHRARKAIKRARAVLRLARVALPAEDHDDARRALRIAARILAPLRDAAASRGILRALASRARPRVRDDVLLLGRIIAAKLGEPHGAARQARAVLVALATRAVAWPLAASWKEVWTALAHCHGQGRRALRRVVRSGTATDAHEFRKRVTAFRDLLALLRPLRPGRLGDWSRRWKRLASELGDHHDLDQLLIVIGKERRRLGGAGHRLREHLLARCENLADSAFEHGARLYADSPARVSGKLWRWRREWERKA